MILLVHQIQYFQMSFFLHHILVNYKHDLNVDNDVQTISNDRKTI